MPVDQVHVAEYIDQRHDYVEEELLTARLTELGLLQEYPHEHDHPVDTGEDEHPVDERRREQRHRRDTGADRKQAPAELHRDADVRHVGLVRERVAQRLVIGDESPGEGDQRRDARHDLADHCKHTNNIGLQTTHVDSSRTVFCFSYESAALIRTPII